MDVDELLTDVSLAVTIAHVYYNSRQSRLPRQVEHLGHHMGE